VRSTRPLTRLGSPNHGLGIDRLRRPTNVFGGMKVLFRSVVLTTVVFLSATSAFAAPPDPKKTGWYLDFAQAKAEAKRTGKPMLVVLRCER
jgi:hypothetical protein